MGHELFDYSKVAYGEHLSRSRWPCLKLGSLRNSTWLGHRRGVVSAVSPVTSSRIYGQSSHALSGMPPISFNPPPPPLPLSLPLSPSSPSSPLLFFSSPISYIYIYIYTFVVRSIEIINAKVSARSEHLHVTRFASTNRFDKDCSRDLSFECASTKFSRDSRDSLIAAMFYILSTISRETLEIRSSEGSRLF